MFAKYSLILTTLLATVPAPAVRAGTYTEDFTTTTFKDTVNTTADWNVSGGELRPFAFSFSLAGSYDTADLAWGVAVAGDHAYVADAASGLVVIDISDATTPTLAATYNTTGAAYGVAVAGDHAFVADFADGLQVIDITDPTNPTLAGTYNTASFAYGVAVAGDHAFVADFAAGLQVIDVSDPANPTLAGTYNTTGSAYAVAVDGDHAFVADWDAGLVVIDISDPTNPTLAGSYNTTGNARGVAVDGDHAFVADATSGLQVIDISDPTAPTLAGTYDTPVFAYGVAVAGDQAYVADHSAGLVVVDVSNPAAPTLVDSYDTPDVAIGVAVAGDYAFVADHSTGLLVVDILDATALPLAGSYDTTGSARGVAVAGDHAFVADGASGLQVIDISDPTNPTLAGTYNAGVTSDVAVAGDHAFVTVGGFLLVVDISDPTAPTLAGSYNTGDARGVAVAGDHAFVAAGDWGLVVVDISDPTNLTLVGTYNTTGSARAVAVDGDHAFVADWDWGLVVIGISDPTAPTLARTFNPVGGALVADVAVDGDLAFVADSSGVWILDVTDPANPPPVTFPMGTFATMASVEGITVAGDHAFIANHADGLRMIDVSDTSNPTLVGTYDTTDSAYAVAVAGEHAFVADATSGLQVIQVFQNEIDASQNVGQSLPFGNGHKVVRARLSTSETPVVAWELSADGGTTFDDFAPGSGWQLFTTPGPDVVWRAALDWTAAGGPAVSDLTIDWLNESALIATVGDIANDQGRQVSVEWTRSGHDFVGDPMQIVEYAIYRRIDPNLTNFAVSSKNMLDGLNRSAREHAIAMQAAGWHFISTVPARAESEYAVVAPTLADSTVANGQYYTTFMVTAFTATPGVFFDSPPDSGYSLDNVAPLTPSSFFINYNTGSGNTLAWDDPVDTDFQYFSVYRSTDPNFIPGPSDLVHTTTSAGWVDPEYDGWAVYYSVSATDFSGNESDPTSSGTVTSVPDPVIPSHHALYQNSPNPFNPTTTIRFDVARGGGMVTLQIFDVSGRLVRTLVDATEGEGQKSVEWDGRDDRGEKAATGIYFYRLTAPGFTQTRKMVLLK